MANCLPECAKNYKAWEEIKEEASSLPQAQKKEEMVKLLKGTIYNSVKKDTSFYPPQGFGSRLKKAFFDTALAALPGLKGLLTIESNEDFSKHLANPDNRKLLLEDIESTLVSSALSTDDKKALNTINEIAKQAHP